MNTNVFVYIAGPMTPKDGYIAEENVLEGLRTHIELINLGVPNFCPHLSGGFPSSWTMVSWKKWLEFDIAIIARCTHMLMLPRWESSKGATEEREYALHRGIPVVYSIEELINLLEA